MADLNDMAQEFRDLARNLALVGATELRQELYTAINDATKPVLDDIRAGLADRMPNRYAETLDGDLALGVSKRMGVDTAGVFVTAQGRARRRKVRRLEAGLLSHPVYGDREVWRTQTAGMRPGFFTGPIDAAAPKIREAILAAMRRVADKATGKRL